MTREEYLDNSNLMTYNTQKINELENLYNGKIREGMSFQNNWEYSKYFYEELYLMSDCNPLVINFDKDMKTDLTKQHIIPIFDIYDNNYIVYHIDQGLFYMMNVEDNSLFNSNSDLREYIKAPQKLSEVIREMFGL